MLGERNQLTDNWLIELFAVATEGWTNWMMLDEVTQLSNGFGQRTFKNGKIYLFLFSNHVLDTVQ